MRRICADIGIIPFGIKFIFEVVQTKIIVGVSQSSSGGINYKFSGKNFAVINYVRNIPKTPSFSAF
jgi:hypothetical protein